MLCGIMKQCASFKPSPQVQFFFLLFSLLLSCAQIEPSKTEFVFGTVCTITLYDQGKDSVYRDVFARLREIENYMSVNISASDVSRINAAAGIEPIQVREDVFTVIERALFYAQLTDGAFDPTVQPLVSLWGFSDDKPHVPSQPEIREVLPLINAQNVEINRQTRAVFLKERGMALDLGGIAKGYAADEAAQVIKNAGINRAIIDLGGDIVILGEPKDKRPWRVGIQNPNSNPGIFFGVLEITAKDGQQSVVTSGAYERFFEEDGIRYHHIFSPFSGEPIINDLLSVTVIAPIAMDADALSTAVFVMGYEKGKQLIDSLPGTEAIFVFNNKSVRTTGSVDFTITDNSYHLIHN